MRSIVRRDGRKPVAIQVFDSVGELVEYGKGPSPDFEGGRASREGDQSFTETRDWTAAVNLARTGWDTHRGKVDLAVSAALEQGAAEGWTGGEHDDDWFYDVCGSDLDVGRALSGDPEYMIEYGTTGVTPTVRILLGICTSAATPTNVIVQRGAAVTALIEVLSRCGINTELWCEASTDPGPGRIEAYFCVKSFDEPMDINRFMFAAAHPSSLRRMAFAAWERAPKEIRDKANVRKYAGYGRVTSSQNEDEVIGHVDLKIKSEDMGGRIVRDTAGWVKDAVAALKSQKASEV